MAGQSAASMVIHCILKCFTFFLHINVMQFFFSKGTPHAKYLLIKFTLAILSTFACSFFFSVSTSGSVGVELRINIGFPSALTISPSSLKVTFKNPRYFAWAYAWTTNCFFVAVNFYRIIIVWFFCWWRVS